MDGLTCSDASETGGGICASTSVTPLGSLGMAGGPLKASLSQEFLVIEWFAGIGGTISRPRASGPPMQWGCSLRAGSSLFGSTAKVSAWV